MLASTISAFLGILFGVCFLIAAIAKARLDGSESRVDLERFPWANTGASITALLSAMISMLLLAFAAQQFPAGIRDMMLGVYAVAGVLAIAGGYRALLAYYPVPSGGREQSANGPIRVRSRLSQALDEWFACLIGFSAGAYIIWGCLVSLSTGIFNYHTKLNLGHPVPVELSSTPLTFVGLVLVQMGLASFLIYNVGWWGLRHILRRHVPTLGLSARDSSRLPGGALLVLGAAILFVGLALQGWSLTKS